MPPIPLDSTIGNQSEDRMHDGFTIGVEEEYQLVEPTTGELRSLARAVRGADLTGEVSGEVQETMIEIGTPVCNDAAGLAESLRQRRFQASAAAATEDLEVIAAGMHPFSGWKGQLLSDDERPRMLMGLFGQLLRQQHICGMHVHIAIPAELDRVSIMNVVRCYAPHLLALSSSSPFTLGEDTRFASFRAVVWRGFPFTGSPPRFASAAEYEAFTALLHQGRMIPDDRTLYWSVRPSARYPTLELRMCDACPRLSDAVAIASLARAVVVAAATGRLPQIGGTLSPSLQDELLRENEWIAARDGLDATLVVPEERDRRIPIRDAIAELVQRVAPFAEELGDAEALSGVGDIMKSGTAADRLRGRQAEGAGWPELVDWLVQETRAGTGIDRRKASR